MDARELDKFEAGGELARARYFGETVPDLLGLAGRTIDDLVWTEQAVRLHRPGGFCFWGLRAKVRRPASGGRSNEGADRRVAHHVVCASRLTVPATWVPPFTFIRR